MARKRKNPLHYLGFVLIGVLIFLFISFNYRIIREREGNEEKLEDLKAELEFLKERKTDLETSLDQVEDRHYIERVLREDFLMKKPGEEKVVILTEEEEEEQIEEEKEEKTRFDKFKEIIPFVE